MSLSPRGSFPRLFSPIKIGGRTINNRVIMSPLSLNLEAQWRKESKPYWEALAEFYAARARGGTELIVVGGAGTSMMGRWNPRAFSLSTYQAADGYRQVTDAIHEAGGAAILQLSHAGRAAASPLTLEASDVPNPYAFYKDWHKAVPVPLWMMRFIKFEFQRCASLAVHAGFDGVEVNAAHGTLLHNFLCRHTNKRDDQYGGSMENRVRLLMHVLGAVRETVPANRDFTVACRLSAHDLHPEGNTREDIMYTFERVGDCGLVDLITTSVGLPDSPVPTLHSYVPKGIFSRCVKEIRTHLKKQNVHVPIAASHRITSPAVAEQLLAGDACDMVGVGRALLADSQFVKNAKENNHVASIPCIGCNWCADQFWKNKRVGCALNPRSGYELERPLHPATHPRAIAVVGAGATGIVCALTLARRGHTVILYERNDEIGGQLNFAKLIPGKEDYWAILDHWTRELKESNVQVKLNSRFCRADVAGGQQMLHAVVFCCGSQPRPISSHNFVTAENRVIVGWWDILTRKVIPGHKCAIIGNGAIGYDMASYLLHDPRISRDEIMWMRENGVSTEDFSVDEVKMQNPPRNQREVTIIQRPNHPPGLNVTSGWSLKNRIKHHQGVVINNGLIAKVDDLGLHMQVHKEGKTDYTNMILKADTIIWCFGMLPNMVEGTWIHEWLKDGAIDRGQAAADFRMYIAGSGRNVHNMQGQGEEDLLLCINEGFEIGSKI